jgi:hypothetical protein
LADAREERGWSGTAPIPSLIDVQIAAAEVPMAQAEKPPMRLFFPLAAAAVFAAPAAAFAQDIVQVERVTGVALLRQDGALVVTAGGTVPVPKAK